MYAAEHALHKFELRLKRKSVRGSSIHRRIFSGIAIASITLAAQADTGGTFVLTGPMHTERVYSGATTLADGRVLIAGGDRVDADNNIEVLSSAELFDPVSRTFSPTGPMIAGRQGPHAVLLLDGRVLIVGGFTSGCASCAELFDPSTQTFTLAGAVVEQRLGSPTAVRLTDGKVLIAGGIGSVNGSSGYLAGAELYDPLLDTFISTGAMNVPRDGASYTLLEDGTVLVAGGVNTSGLLISAEIFDPQIGQFALTGPMGAARYPNASLLQDGRVLVFGGFDDSGYLTGAEIYDPSTHAFSPTGSLIRGRGGAAVSALEDGRVLVAGGQGGGGAEGILTEAETYDPDTGEFSATANLNISRTQPMVARLLDGSVLVAGGTSFSGIRNSAELYIPAGDPDSIFHDDFD